MDRAQRQDSDYYDGWGDHANDPRNYDRAGEPVVIHTRRFPEGEPATIEYCVAGTACYCVRLVNTRHRLNAYALPGEMS